MRLDSNLIYFCNKQFRMKKSMIVIALALLVACGGEEKKTEQNKPEAPLTQSKNSAEFNASFAVFLDNYYHLKDALVLTSDPMANTAAQRLVGGADSINLSAINADSSIVQMAKGYIETISAEAKGLIGEQNIEGKRKSFQMISDNMYDLVRTVRYDQEKVYHQFCPMAFNDAGAYWLSKTSDIKNPYFGKKMLTCGEVKDSLDFK
jgi:hypothetical protein